MSSNPSTNSTSTASVAKVQLGGKRPKGHKNGCKCFVCNKKGGQAKAKPVDEDNTVTSSAKSASDKLDDDDMSSSAKSLSDDKKVKGDVDEDEVPLASNPDEVVAPDASKPAADDADASKPAADDADASKPAAVTGGKRRKTSKKSKKQKTAKRRKSGSSKKRSAKRRRSSRRR